MVTNKTLCCFLVGLVFLGFGIFLHISYENAKSRLDQSTMSTKMTYTTSKSKYRSKKSHRYKEKTMYRPTYQFIVNNKTYFCESKISSSVPPSNEPREIYYSSKNPNDCLPKKNSSDNIWIYIIGLMAVASFGFGIKEIINPTTTVEDGNIRKIQRKKLLR